MPLLDGAADFLREGAEASHGGWDNTEGAVDFVWGGEAGEGEAEAGASLVGGEAHGEQDVRGLGGAGLAGGSEAGGDALHVERDEEGFGVHVVEAEVGGVGGAVGGRAVDVGSGSGGDEALFEAGCQRSQRLWSFRVEPGEG